MSETLAEGPASAPAVAAPGPYDDHHNQIEAQYDQLESAQARLSRAANELGVLGKLGDTVSTEAVVKGAGRLVAQGESPVEMAKLLGSMPPPDAPGSALQAWVAGQTQAVEAKLAQIAQMREQARHALAVSAMQRIILGGGGGVMTQPAMSAGPAPAMANELIGGPASGS